ncbi:MAG: zinc ABC transporter substrate-binding protein [Planctomycetota bacterium]|nr:MAG: zinc ABC transporter substrate-binding protein [Planctomycetota bacterium]
MRLPALLLHVSIICGILWSFQSLSANERDDRPLIVVSTTQIADFTRQIVGDRMRVHGILAPGADPHTYQPTPGDARRVGRAALVIDNGLFLEGSNWMATLAEDADRPLVTATDGVRLLELPEEEQEEYQYDPHAWFDPANAAVYVRNITRAVSEVSPQYADEFRARSALYLAQLRALDGWIREQLAVLPDDRRLLVTSHDAFEYFARAYDMRTQAPVGWSTGAEMGAGLTPERRRQVVAAIAESGVPAIFVETSVNPAVIRQLAEEAGVAVADPLYSDSMGAEGTAGATYIGMMRENVLIIIAALAPDQEAD